MGTREINLHEGYSTAGAGWLYCPAVRPDASLRLFCFPHAGGTASAFRLWPKGLPRWLEVWAIQLPGRGSRWREPAIATMSALVDALVPLLASHLRQPFAFFGHSMGAALAFEVARRLATREGTEPSHVFVSSRRPAHIPSLETKLRDLPDEEFIREINGRYGGVPNELLESRDLLSLLLPALRADIVALETVRASRPEPAPFPISAYGGAHDHNVPKSHLEAWRDQTESLFRTRMFPGGHFYIEPQQDALLADIAATLTPIVRSFKQEVCA